ncbi:MAG: type IV secretion protein Rhs, partial [Nitrosomonadales bacterium]|nr:type IV secretion protein Rhs [Nitrosomonadales bacterium]
MRNLIASGIAVLFGLASCSARADHADPAPVDDMVMKKLVQERLSAPDPLFNTLSAHLDEAATLLKDVEREAARPYASETARQGALSTKHMLLSAKRAELETVRAEVRVRLDATRAKLAKLGLANKFRDWDDLSAKVENRFDRVEKVLEEVRTATDMPSRTKALSHAKAELRVLHEDVRMRESGIPPGTTPGWRTETPQPATKQEPAKQVPQYMAYHRAPGSNVYAFLGNTLLAPLPPVLPSDAPTNCGILATNDPSLAATQDVQITQEIRDLAASLNYSPAKIYQYIYQNIRFEPYYGSLKGSVGTLYAKAGSATDQASLLIALLRASNIPARFVKGQIQFLDPTPDALGGRAARWVGAKSYAGAAAILATGRNPGAAALTNASGQATGITLTHVWVEACVPYSHYRGTQQDTTGSRWIPLDASFKDIGYQAGIATNVAFDYTGYLAKRTNALADEYYANQVLPTIQAAGVAPYNTNNTLADVPYTGTLNPLTVDVLPASTPYDVSAFLPWAGTTLPEIADLPDSHRYKLNITVSQGAGTQLLSATLSMPQTALSRVTLSFQGVTAADQTALAAWQNDGTLTSATPSPTPCNVISVVPVLKGPINGVEGATIATGPSLPATSTVDLCTVNNQLTMSITLAELANPTLNTRTYTNITAAGYHALQGYAFQASDRLLTERAALLLANVKATPNPNSNLDATEGEFLNLVGLKYLRYVTDEEKRIGQLDGESGETGNNIGLTASAMKVVYLFDIPFAVARTGFLVDMPGMVSRSTNLTTGQGAWKTFLLGSYGASALEYYIWHENVRMDAVSTVRGLQFASESGIPILTLKMTSPTSWTADSANLCTVVNASCPNSLTLYPAGILSSIQALYSAGYTITLPNTMIQYGDWIGAVYVGALNNIGTGLTSQAAFMIGGGYAGGYTVRPVGQVGPGGVPMITYNAANGSGYVTPNPAVVNPATGLAYATNSGGLNNGYDPKYSVIDGDANVANGNVFRVEKDIAIAGRGGLPLVFERAYNSRNPTNGPFGYGWTHSFNHYLSFKDDNANGIVDAPDTDGLSSSVGWTDGTGGEKLFQVAGTAAGVAIGSAFTAVPGTFASMTRNADGTYSVVEKDGMTYTFENMAGTIGQKARLASISDRNGNTFTLTYAAACNNNLCSVKDGLNRTLTFSYNADIPVNHITAISDWAGRQYQYGYTDTFGNLNSYANPLAVAGKQQPVTYQYFTLADGANLNHALKRYTLPRGNGMGYEYYATGKLFRRTDALGYTRTYTYNDFRRETDETTERGGTRKFFFDQYGNTAQFVEENGATHNYTYDIAAPANVYNRIGKQDPAGYKTNFAYDTLGNITQVTNPSGSTVAYANFTAFNQPGKVKDANGNYTVRQYDAKGNLTQELHLTKAYCTLNNCALLNPATYVPAAADMVSWKVYGYDIYGNRTATKLVRDFAAQVASPTASSATGPVITRSYDANGLYPATIARSGKQNSDLVVTTQTASVVYDSLGRQTAGIDADWYPIQSGYDTADHKILGTDAAGKLRSYQYDANDNPSGERLDLLGSLLDSRSASYDLNDRKQSSVDAGGNITAYQYDAAGNIIAITNPDAYTLGIGYDLANHEIRRSDAQNHAITRTLDAEGKPRTVTDPNGNATTTAYYDSTGDGRLKSISDAGNHQIGMAYDANGNPTAVT